jgi:hypothetical protein
MWGAVILKDKTPILSLLGIMSSILYIIKKPLVAKELIL